MKKSESCSKSCSLVSELTNNSCFFTLKSRISNSYMSLLMAEGFSKLTFRLNVLLSLSNFS